MSDQNTASNTINLLDEFIAEDELLDDIIGETMLFFKASIEALGEEVFHHRLRAMNYIKSPREEYHQGLVNYYFSNSHLDPLDIFH